MRKRTTLTAIDVGTTKVCTTIAEVNEGGTVRVAGVGVTPSMGLHKGLVVNISEARESIRESVRRAEQASGYKVESAYIGVTGRHVSSLNNRGVVAITRNDRLVRPDDLRRVLACAQNVRVPSDRKLLHVIPRGYAVDGQVGVKNPVGMHGFRLDVETHIITAAVTSVQNLVKCIRSIGIDVDDLVLEPLASSEAVLTEDEKEIGLPFDVSEEMKKRYGSFMPVFESKRETSSTISENGHGVSYQDLCDIIRARVEEIIRLILLELPRSEHEALVPAGLVITGGSANLSGIEALGRDILRLPVRVGIPTNMHGITDVLRDPAYATSVGLLLWGAKHEGRRAWKSRGLLRRLIFRIKNLFR